MIHAPNSLTGDLSQRSDARAVALLRVHLPGVGAAPQRGSHGAPGPRQSGDRAEKRQQRVPGQRQPGVHPQKWVSGGREGYIKPDWVQQVRINERLAGLKVRAVSPNRHGLPISTKKRLIRTEFY